MQDEQNPTDTEVKQRRIRSFVVRGGRMTDGQQKAYDANWEVYGLDVANGRIAYEDVFGRTSDVVLEVGFGMGASLLTMAKENPNTHFLGIEVHRPGVGNFLDELEKQQIF